MAERLKQNKFTLDDYMDQMQQLKSMGNIKDIAAMLPGMDSKALKGATLDEKAFSRTEAIISSMTPTERENPVILNGSRKRRIAAGSGTTVVEVNRLLKQFEMTRSMAKQMTGGGKKAKRMAGMMGFPGMGKGMPF